MSTRSPKRPSPLSTALVAALGLSLAPACAPGAPPPPGPVTVEEILRIRSAGAPTWSPDGSRVAFTWGVGAELNLWTADTAATEPGTVDAESVRQISPLAGRSDAAISPDWTRMAYASEEHVWTVPLEGGRPVPLTGEPDAEEGDDEGATGEDAGREYSDPVWSPDGTMIAFVARTENPDQTDVGVVSAEGGDVTWIADGPTDEDSPIWAPDSRRLVYQRRTDDWHGYEIRLSDADGSDQRTLVTERYGLGVEEFRLDDNRHWSPDGDRIVYLSSRTGYNHLWVVPVDGGEPVELTTGEWVDYSPRWSPTGDRIAFVSSRVEDLEERHVWVVDAGGGEPIRISSGGFSTSPSWSADGERLAYLRSTATRPPEVVVQDATPGAPARRLTESLPDPTMTAGFVEPEPIRYPSRDGTEVPAMLLRPDDPPEGSRPGLLWFHGKGGINLEGWGGMYHYAFHQRLVEMGYSIVFVNWRGTHIGYGNEWERANYRDYAGGELDDVVGGARFLEEELGIDPDRIGCWGGSYGGYMTMLTVTREPDVCDAGISLYGVSDWDTFLEQSQRKLWNVRLLAKLGPPDENPELYHRSAAIDFVGQATSPLLILQGQDDDGVVPEQGISLYEALLEAGKEADYVAYVGEGHGFRHVGSVRDLYRRTEEFFTRHIGGS